MDMSIDEALKQSRFETKKHKKFLSSTSGSACPYVVCYQENELEIHHLELTNTVYTFEFPKDVQVMDIDHFPSNDGSFGLVVGLHDEKLKCGAENYVVGLIAGPGSQVNLKLKWSLAIPQQITIVKTLFTNQDMAYNTSQFNLNSKLEKWPHIISVGARNSFCFIVKLQEHDDVDVENVSININARNYVDILSSYRSESDGTFTYETDEISNKYKQNKIDVTSLALLTRSQTLLIGLSMGGIIRVALNPSNEMNQLDLRHGRCIRHLVPLESEDDAETHEHFLAVADGSSTHAIMLHLWRGRFKNEDSNQQKFYVNMEHQIRHGKRWICAKTTTHDGLLGENLNETRNNFKTSRGSSLRSSCLLVYEKIDSITRETVIEASIFDIDAFYYYDVGVVRIIGAVQNIKQIECFFNCWSWIYNRFVCQFLSHGIVSGNDRIGVMSEQHRTKIEAARLNKCELAIQLVVREMHKSVPNAYFWNKIPYDRWYPPHPSNLLAPLLKPEISEELKRALVTNYLLDWFRACEMVTNDDDIAEKTHRIISDVMGTDMEKILYILEQEKEAIKKKPNSQVLKTIENIDWEKNETDSPTTSPKKVVLEVQKLNLEVEDDDEEEKIPTSGREGLRRSARISERSRTMSKPENTPIMVSKKTPTRGRPRSQSRSRKTTTAKTVFVFEIEEKVKPKRGRPPKNVFEVTVKNGVATPKKSTKK